MSRPRTLVLAVLVAGSLLWGTAAVGASAVGSQGVPLESETPTASNASPTVAVSADSTPVSGGDRYETGRPVDLTVDAAVGREATDGTTLDEVVVRVNGERAASVDINGTRAAETVNPDLENGDNEVRVIVTDSAGAVNSTRFTVFFDDTAPHVFLTEPYRTDPYRAIPDGSVNGSATTFAGGLVDASAVERLQITHTYGPGYRDVHVIRDPRGNFSVDLSLGYTGNRSHVNELRITARDEFDNVRVYNVDVNATDGGPPTVSIEPYPNATSANRFSFAGTIRDDVWIRRAHVTFRSVDLDLPADQVRDSASVVDARAYELDPDGRTATFNESFYPSYPGTYEVVVNATDVTGERVTRTYEVVRRRDEPEDRRPEVAVDRDRTVVLDDETLFVSGAAFEGRTRRLVVETRDPVSGDTVDYQVVYAGSGRDRVEFDREVGIAAGPTAVIVRATDPDDNEVTERFYVNGSARTAFVGDESAAEADPWPRVTVTPLEDGRPATASSSVSVVRVRDNATVGIPATDGPAAVAETSSVALNRLTVAAAEPGNLTATVVLRERGDGPLRGPPGSRPAATVTVQHAHTVGTLRGVTFEVAVDRRYLDRHGVTPADLTLYRRSGDEWTDLGAEMIESAGGTVRYRIDSPGLSVFSLANRSAGGVSATDGSIFDHGSDGNASVVTGPGGGWEFSNGTLERVAGSQTAENRTGADAGTDAGSGSRIRVANVTLNRTRVAVNETVAVNATLVNAGNASGTTVAGLQTLRNLSRTFVTTATVSVPAGEERRVEYVHRFDEPGNYTVSVNGTEAGPVVVSRGGGGFLSVFSFLPLRLIGMVLGAFVGLVVVLVLVRFVLGRVGGGEEGASG